jgi:hypothetical protein
MQRSPFAIITVAAASLGERWSIVDRLVADAKVNRTPRIVGTLVAVLHLAQRNPPDGNWWGWIGRQVYDRTGNSDGSSSVCCVGVI